MVIDVVLTIILSVMSLYDFMFSQRSGGDPTQVPDVTGARAITYDNPGYREGEHSKEIESKNLSQELKTSFNLQIEELR